MVKCVLFDIDNTLLLKKPSLPEKVYGALSPSHPEISMEMVERAYADSELWQGEQVMRENETGIRLSDEDYLNGILNVYARYLPMEGIDSSALMDLLQGKCEYSLVPGVLEVLHDLKAMGIHLGVVSNNRPEIRQVIEDYGLYDFFEATIISEEVNLYKPDPKILKLACREIGYSPKACIYVGDHPFDILCAHNAGLACCWFPPNAYFELPDFIGTPEWQIGSFEQISEIVK